MSMVELVVTDIMSRAGDNRAHVLLLQERDGLRKIVVALGLPEAQSVAFHLHNYLPPRPFTHDLFRSLSLSFDIQMEYMLIFGINDGTFLSKMVFKRGDEVKEVEARTSDAIAIALRMNSRIYITDELLNRMCIRDELNGAISIPITAADERTLRQAMDRAVEVENYELAMKLKEELDSRRSSTTDTDNDTNTK